MFCGDVNSSNKTSVCLIIGKMLFDLSLFQNAVLCFVTLSAANYLTMELQWTYLLCCNLSVYLYLVFNERRAAKAWL